MLDFPPLVQAFYALHYKYLKACEQNSTEMFRELADLEIKTKTIIANREVATKYFEQNLEEQRKVYVMANQMLDIAIKKGDSKISQIALRIIEIAHNKPIL